MLSGKIKWIGLILASKSLTGLYIKSAPSPGAANELTAPAEEEPFEKSMEKAVAAQEQSAAETRKRIATAYKSPDADVTAEVMKAITGNVLEEGRTPIQTLWEMFGDSAIPRSGEHQIAIALTKSNDRLQYPNPLDGRPVYIPSGKEWLLLCDVNENKVVSRFSLIFNYRRFIVR